MHAKRTGGFVAAAFARTCPVSAARNGSDSSHGRVREIPAAPRRKVRRETDWLQEKAPPAFMVSSLAQVRGICNEITTVTQWQPAFLTNIAWLGPLACLVWQLWRARAPLRPFVANFVVNLVEVELCSIFRICLAWRRLGSKVLVPEWFPRGRELLSAGRDPSKLPPSRRMRQRSQETAVDPVPNTARCPQQRSTQRWSLIYLPPGTVGRTVPFRRAG